MPFVYNKATDKLEEYVEKIHLNTYRQELDNGFVETTIKTVLFHKTSLDEQMKDYFKINSEPTNNKLAAKYHQELSDIYDKLGPEIVERYEFLN